MNSNTNRGMLLETIINKTIKQYKDRDMAIFHKKQLDIKFSSIDEMKNIKNGVVMSKSTVDYYGIYRGFFVAFEAKSSNTNNIPKSNFKEHQHNYLKQIKKHQGFAFYIFLFKETNEFFMADISIINYEKKSITIEYIRKNAISLDLIFPGVIDFIEHL